MNSGAIPGAERPRAIIVAHGDLADGIVSAVQQISGRGEVFLPMTNRGLGAAELERELREQVDRLGIRIIMTDLPAGSCTIAARRVQRDRPTVTVLAGANLAALLDFAFHTEAPTGEAAERAAERARAAVTVLRGPRGD